MTFQLGSRSRTIRYLNRSKRTKNTGPWILAAIALAILLFLWGIGAALFALSSVISSEGELSSSSSSFLKLADGRGFLKHPLDLWPDDLGGPLLDHNLYTSCLPQDEPDRCHMPENGDVIAIVGTPGVFSNIMAAFVKEFVQASSVDGDRSVIVVHNVASALSNPSIAYIVRPSVIPPILEALDLILQTSSTPGEMLHVSTPDALQVLREVLQWHCRMDVVAKDRAFLTVSLDDVLAYPKVAEDSLADFLGYESTEKKVVNVSPLALQALQRIQDASKLSERIAPEKVAAIIQEHLDSILSQGDHCLTSHPLQETPQGHHLSSQILDLVHEFLSPNPATETLCKKYPLSKLCQEQI